MKRILPVIVISQFFCTSLWFAGNAVMADMMRQFNLAPGYLAYLTSTVQLGFIAGTLVFAVFNIADRFSPSRVFFACAVVAALINLGVSVSGIGLAGLMTFRFLTGFFLAGIYPVGMKIAADHYAQGLGRSLGFLVGALVLGTALPHLLKSLMVAFPYQYVIYTTSLLSVTGGLAMLLLVPDGPYRKAGTSLKPGAFLTGFRDKKFSAAAFGYFGHMWELYAFWAFVPVMLTAYQHRYPLCGFNVPLLSFFIIALGSLACVLSGFISQRFGAGRVATVALFTSGLCCLASPVFLFTTQPVLLIAFLMLWSMAVIADSPLFSTLVAQNAPVQTKGTSLTIVNCIGFSVTIVSIQLINALRNDHNLGYIYMLLALGPVLGLIGMVKQKER